MSYPSIHEAFQFGQTSQKKDEKNKDKKSKEKGREESRVQMAPSQQEMTVPPAPQEQQIREEVDTGRYPSDASNSMYPIKVRCPKCGAVSMTRMSSELGAAAWVWCVLLSPFACMGISCLCFQSCRDKVHFCNRCGAIVGKKHAKVC